MSPASRALSNAFNMRVNRRICGDAALPLNISEYITVFFFCTDELTVFADNLEDGAGGGNY